MLLAYASLLTAAVLSGCTSATKLAVARSSGDAVTSRLRPSRVCGTRRSPTCRSAAGDRSPRHPPTDAAQGRGRRGSSPTAAETPPGAADGCLDPRRSRPPTREYPIDLTTALRLAEVENPLIAEARQRIGEALAVQQGARALLLPIAERRDELPRPHRATSSGRRGGF